MEASNILEAREDRIKIIKKDIDKYQIVSVHANIAGIDKNIKEAYFLVNHFSKLVSRLNPISEVVNESDDGIYKLFYFNKDKNLKEECVKIEESDRLGRFIDLDVFYDSDKSESRGALRKCFICDEPAFVCARLKRHSDSEINGYIKINVLDYMHSIITKYVSASILKELNLEPKFGLVCKNNKSSHKDMDYALMLKAKDAIEDDFYKFFELAYLNDDIDFIKTEMRNIGLDMEKKMLIACSNVNAYKGLIFNLGILLCALGLKLKSNTALSIFEYVGILAKGITEELKEGLDTFGKVAYKKYGILGARGEAEACFKNLYDCMNIYNLDNDLLDALIYLIINIEDTTLLKRCGSIEKYNFIKNEFIKSKDINYLNDLCLKENLSFGGAADLLILACFLKDINDIFELGI